MIFWKRKLIECCKCHKRYSFDDNLFYHLKDYILVCPYCNLMHKVNIKLLGKEYEELKKVDKLNLAAIYVGEAATNRATAFICTNTLVNMEPANGTGTIDTINIYVNATLANCEVGIFYVVSGNFLSTRDSVLLGNVLTGLRQVTVDSESNPISLDVEEGDFIGIHAMESHSKIEADGSGGSGIWLKAGDQIPADNVEFASYANYAISLNGTGVTAGWPHKWNGATIGKLNGAVISKWNGVP